MTETTADTKPIQAFDVRVDAADDGVLLVRGMEAYELDAVGSEIWRACDGETTIADIARELTKTFDVDEATALADTLRLVTDMRVAGLIE